MRRYLQISALALTAAALVCVSSHAGEKDKKDNKGGAIGKEPTVIDAELAATDPVDKMTKQPSKTHKVQLEAGKVYRIEMRSNDLDSFLRLENADGKQLAFDDDGAGFPHARIVQKIDAAGEYRIIATCFDGKLGKYTVTIQLANARDVLAARVKDLPNLPPAEQEKLFEEFKTDLANNIDKIAINEVQSMMSVAQGLEFGGNTKLAATAYKDFGAILAKSKDEKFAALGKSMAGAARRMGLVGNPITVYGQTLQGKEFDFAKYKGKVVLVDFWATWCGPCRAEIPNMKKLYEAYHERGFEVVAISLDNGKDAPVKYMEQEKLPWVCLFDPEPGEKREPLAQHYGIFAIPQAILVDREGRVVSMNARGAELERLLEKHIGPRDKNSN